MPIVNIPGVGSVNFPDSMSNEDITKAIETDILKTSPAQVSKQTSFTDDVVIGAKNLGHMAADAGQLLAGGLASAVGNTDQADIAFGDMVARNKQWQEDIKSYGQQDLTGKVISGLTGMVPAVAAMPFVGPAPAMGILSGMSALSRGKDNINAGATAGQAIAQATGEAAMDMTAAKLIPQGSGLLKGAGYGAAGNIAAQFGQDTLGQNILPESAQEPYKGLTEDPEKYIVSGATGALPGAVIGKMTPDVKPQPKPQTIPKHPNKIQASGKDVNLEDAINKAIFLNNTNERIKKTIAETETALEKIVPNIETMRAKAEKAQAMGEHAKAGKLFDTLAKMEGTLEGYKKKIDEGRTEIEINDGNIQKLSEYAKIDVEDIIPSKAVAKVDEPIFRSEEEALRSREQSKGEANSSMDALLRTASDTQEILAEKQALIEKPNKTLEDDLRIAELEDLYTESLVRNNPRDELKSAMRDLIEERDNDLPMLGPEDASYVQARTAQIDRQLSKYAEFERRATDAVRQKTEQAELKATTPALKATIDKVKSDGTMSPRQVQDTLDVVIRYGTMREGLQKIADSQTSPALSRVARYLLNNETIGKFTKLAYDKDIEGAMQTKQGAGADVFARSKKELTLTHYVHEAVHVATSGIMRAAQQGVKFHPEVHKALKNLDDVYQELLGPARKNIEASLANDFYAKLHDARKAKEEARLLVDTVLENPRELLAYGMTMPHVMKALDSIEVKGQTLLRTMYDAVATTIGLGNKQMRTALQAVFESGETLIKHSEGRGESFYTGKPSDTIDNAARFKTDTGDIGYHASNRFLDYVVKLPHQAAMRFLSPWSLKNFWGNNQMINRIGDIAIKTRDEATQLQNEILYGRVSEEQFRQDFGDNPLKLFKLNKIQNGDSLLGAIENVKYADIGSMIDGIVAAYRDGVSAYKNVDKYFTGLSKEQLNFLRVLDLVPQKMRDRVNSDLKARKLSEIAELPGYFPVHNTGKYYVDHTVNGVQLGRYWFYSKLEANDYAAKLKENDSKSTAIVEERTQDMDYQPIMDVLQEIIDKNGDKGYVKALQASIASKASAVGKHKEHRDLIRGFSGERFGSLEERGKNFATGVVNWVTEYSNAARTRKLLYDTATYMNSEAGQILQMKQPNAYAVARHFLDNELNAYGRTSPLAKGINAVGEPVVKLLNESSYLLTGKHLNKDVIESGFDIMKRLSYNLVLTSAPVTWVAQALAVVQSGRMFAQHANNPIDAFGAAMRGIHKTLFKGYDEDSMRGLWHVSQNMDVLHKTIHHDLGGIDAASVNKGQLDKWYSRLVGEKMTEGADTFSRIATWNMAYEMLKANGLRGKKLWEEAAKLTSENMIPMGREHLPSLYKETGFVGTMMSPLKGFIHGSFSNLATDVKALNQNPTMRNSLVLTATMLATLIQGGLLGLPFLADYEYIRQLLVKSGAIAHDTLPNWTKIAENQPTLVGRGLIAGLTDIDMSASTRYQSILKPYGDMAAAPSLADASLPLATTKKFIGGVYGVAKDMLGDTPDPAAQKNWDAVLPRGVLRGFKNDMYDNSGMVPFGKRGDALTERGPKERIAEYAGSSSVAAATARDANMQMDLIKKSNSAIKQKAIDLLLSSSESDKNSGREILRDMYTNGDINYDEISSMLNNQALNQHKPLLDRMITNRYGVMASKPQARTLRDLIEHGYKK